MDSLNLMFSTNASIVNRSKEILSTPTWDWELFHDTQSIFSYLADPVNVRPYIDSIYLYQENALNRVLSSNDGVISLNSMADTNWINSYANQKADKEYWADYRTMKPSAAAIETKRSLCTVVSTTSSERGQG